MSPLYRARHLHSRIASAVAIAWLVFSVSEDLRFAYGQGIEAPFGDKLSPSVTNYKRIRPAIGTAGVLKEAALVELKALGFVAILDLRTPEEGTETEKVAAEAVGLRYFNIPVSEQAPTEAQVQVFIRLVEDAANYPLLIHCQTANRVGAIWTMYRVRKGVPFAIAVEEGRSIGLQPGREKAVRAQILEPLLAK
jgi:uncharacterized protein (TIGR01244 family)